MQMQPMPGKGVSARIGGFVVNDWSTIFCHVDRMLEERLTLRQADQAREDFAMIAEDLDFIKFQLSRLPTRRELALRPLYVMLGSAGIVILWIEFFHRICL